MRDDSDKVPRLLTDYILKGEYTQPLSMYIVTLVGYITGMYVLLAYCCLCIFVEFKSTTVIDNRLF